MFRGARLSARVEPSASGRQQAFRVDIASLVIERNRGEWKPEPPDTDLSEEMTLLVAAGNVDEKWVADWLRGKVAFQD